MVAEPAKRRKEIRKHVIRVVLIIFRTSQHLPMRIESLKKYLVDAPFVLFSGRTKGRYDWISIQSFESEEIADEESDICRNLFGDIIQSYEVYDFSSLKDPSFHSPAYTKTTRSSTMNGFRRSFQDK